MTLRYSEEVCNAGLDARIAKIGPSPTLEVLDAAGTRLFAIRLPEVWMSKAVEGIARKRGAWSTQAEGKGKAARFTIKSASGSMEGSVPEDMTFDNPVVTKGQNVVVGHFVITAGNRHQ